MTPDEQLDMWLEGKSVHNPTTNECCPDFSCCVPSLQMSAIERWNYVKRHHARKAGTLEPPKCRVCGKGADLRWSVCFECATKDEK